MSKGIPSIAIIGAGFSGAMLVANLVRQTDKPLHVTLIDPAPAGLGMAYSTRESYHLLNVRADRMGAFPNAVEGFYLWLHSPSGKQQTARICPGKIFAVSDYVPRALYAAYVQEIFTQALAEAERKHITVTHEKTEAVGASRENGRYIFTLADGENIRADAAVLACGNLPPRRFVFEKNLAADDARYVRNIWAPLAGSIFPGRVSALAPDSEIVIIGTGLTTVDAVLTLHHQGYKGRITAISRHGLLPIVHTDIVSYPSWPLIQNLENAPRTAYGIFHALRNEVRKVEKTGQDWRAVVDSLRPVTQTLWKQLPAEEKRIFARRLLPFWNVHRHRMAPEIHTLVQSLIKKKTLRIVAGRIEDIVPEAKAVGVSYRAHGAATSENINAACVLNCTGPEMDIAKSSHALLRAMLQKNLLQPAPLDMGVTADENSGLFLLGTLRSGELLESVAVPELRAQAAEVANKLITLLQK